MKSPYANQPIAVLGLGTSGEAAARRLLEEGACVSVLDSGDSEKLRATAEALRSAGARVLLGAEADNDATIYALAVLSPGIDPATALVRGVKARQIPIIGELEFSYSLCACPVIAITGTNGKTTTTQLVERMLNACGVRTLAAGNIGPAFAARVRESAALDVMTLEVSSFQLEAITAFRPAISVWLNFQADHLDRYADMEEYYAAKLRIFENQTADDIAIVKLEDKLPPLKARRITFSAYSQGGDFDLRDGVIHYHGKPVLSMAETQLSGQHNAENLMAALAVGKARGLSFEAMAEPLRTYKALPHRCELVGTIDGVDYINDSKATNLDALEKALLSETRRVVLIAGGKDKGFEFDSLTDLVASKCRAVVLIGEMASRIEGFWASRVPCWRAASLAEAVAQARAQTQRGDAVLFSPGTSSFDMFKSYADRGNQFRALVAAFTESTL